MSILSEIAEKTKERIDLEKERLTLAKLRETAEDLRREETLKGLGEPAFKRALATPGMSFICEVKKASPSKGLIAEDFPFAEIAKEYEKAGASAVSVLTEPYYFKGSDAFLKEIRRNVAIPLLRKDFTVDPYMIYQAKVMGADAVLLICSLLCQTELAEYRSLASELGLAALMEAHDVEEISMALSAGAEIIGVNNRNLKDFTVDVGNSVRLRQLVPPEVIFVSESGMKTREDIARLEEAGVNAVLIGETLMRSADKKGMLEELAGRGRRKA